MTGQGPALPSRPTPHRTRPGRLAAVDAWLEACAPALVGPGALLVDFGYGATPTTTLEWAARCPHARVVGIERAATAAGGVELISGDFETCATLGPTSVVRAMNVLRGYREDEVPRLHDALGAALVDGGLLVEGSTDTDGHVLVAWLVRKSAGALQREALLFHTDFARGFSPWLFRDWLPRELRRRVLPGTAIHGLLEGWEARATACGAREPRARFLGALDAPGLAATPWERDHGFVRASLGARS